MTPTERATLDRYGAAAEAHMRRHLPSRYRQQDDPHSYFRALGDLIAAEVEDLTRALLAGEAVETEFLARAGQLCSARDRAEEIVFAELVYLTPEQTTPTDSRRPEATGVGEGPGWEGWQLELWHRGLDPDTNRPLLSDRHIQALTQTTRTTATGA
jgi:hypothetical protein